MPKLHKVKKKRKEKKNKGRNDQPLNRKLDTNHFENF